MSNYFLHNSDTENTWVIKKYLESLYFKNLNVDAKNGIKSIEPYYFSGNTGTTDIFSVKNTKRIFITIENQFHNENQFSQMSIQFNCTCGGSFKEFANIVAYFSPNFYYENTMILKNVPVFNFSLASNILWFQSYGYVVYFK